MTAFSRLIPAELSVASPGDVVITFAEMGVWGAGGHTVTSVASRAVQVPTYHNATITGGTETLIEESYVLPPAVVTGNATLSLPTAGEWQIVFYCVLDVTPDPPTIGATAVNSEPPYIEATITGGDQGLLVDDYLVPWQGGID